MASDNNFFNQNTLYLPSYTNSSFDTLKTFIKGVGYSTLNGRPIARLYITTLGPNKQVQYIPLYLDNYQYGPETMSLNIGQNVPEYYHISDESHSHSSIRLTNSVFYRHDFTDILLQFVILSYILFYLPTKLIMRLFRKGAR